MVLGEQVQQLELAPGEVEASIADEGLEAVGADLQLAGEQRLCLAGGRLRRRRRVTASIRAIASSGWQGLVIQSSTPRRRPRTRWATVERAGADDDAEVGKHSADPLEVAPAVVAEDRRVEQQRV